MSECPSQWKPKLIASDMDGTLLDAQNRISSRTQTCLRQAHKEGVRIALVTGRVLISPRAYAEILGFPISIVATNGAICCDEQGKRIFEKPLTSDMLALAGKILADSGLYYHGYTDHGYITPYTEHRFATVPGRMPEGYEHLLEVTYASKEAFCTWPESIYKIIIFEDDAQKRAALRERLKIAGLSTSRSYWNNIEIGHPDVSKEKALRALCRHYDIELSDTLAFGDQENDLSMLSVAGRAVLMANAPGDLDVPPYVERTRSNDEEGVYQVLKEYYDHAANRTV